MKVPALTFLAFYINGAIDTGRYDDISINTARDEIRKGSVFAWLETTLGTDIDLSILDAPMKAELLAEWQDVEAAVNIRKKFGVERGGLTLLVALLLEGVQRRASSKV